MVGFRDGVLAITITGDPRDQAARRRQPAARLVDLWPSYLAYALTFLFIGQVWANHHVMFDHIRAADRLVLLLNTLLLMAVAFCRSPPPSWPTRSATGTTSEPPSSSMAWRSPWRH